jgi:hypothetical protein
MQQMLEQQGMIQGLQQPGGETPQQPSEQAPQ